MNEKVDLTKILKDCPEGTELYSPLCGKVVFKYIKDSIIYTTDSSNSIQLFSKEGFYYYSAGVECLLFPSETQRDWSKFIAPWYKLIKPKFDPKTLQPFDKVLVKDRYSQCWRCNLFSHIETEYPMFRVNTILVGHFYYCIPYNEDTAYLVGTKDEPSEFYRYWED